MNRRGLEQDDVKDMLYGLDSQWTNLLAVQLRSKFAAAIASVKLHLSATLFPPPDEIFDECRRVHFNDVKTIIVWSAAAGADGLLRDDTIIFPLSLLLSAPADAQPSIIAGWQDYTFDIIKMTASARPTRIILVGDDACEQAPQDKSTIKFPSAAMAAPSFDAIDKYLRGRQQRGILWNTLDDSLANIDNIIASLTLPSHPLADADDIIAAMSKSSSNRIDSAAAVTSPLYLFTDGGCSGNGSAKCVASWGYVVVEADNVLIHEEYGLVPPVKIPGEKYKSSNNRGELTAMLRGLTWLDENMPARRVVVATDSDYCINAITVWGPKWQRQNITDKKNLDLIHPLISMAGASVTFKHIRSHRGEPRDKDSAEWFFWHGNDRADLLCNVALGRTVIPATNRFQ